MDKRRYQDYIKKNKSFVEIADELSFAGVNQYKNRFLTLREQEDYKERLRQDYGIITEDVFTEE